MPEDLKTRLSEDMKQAMRDRNAEVRDTVRYLLAGLKNEEINRRVTLTREDEIAFLRTQAKQRQDSIEMFDAGGRKDLADREREQLRIIGTYLPEQFSEEELVAFARDGVAEAGASGPRDMGKVMGLLSARSAGRVDGRRLSAAVKSALSGE